jgi:hypothetical protein
MAAGRSAAGESKNGKAVEAIEMFATIGINNTMTEINKLDIAL